MKGGDKVVSTLESEYYKSILNYAGVNLRQTKCRGKHQLAFCHPIILFTHFSPSFLCSLKTFFTSSLPPQIVVRKLLGFCGF